ncbi:hypothetical protein [Nocardia sp. NPDC057227]|uniref:hypothetical protein n=1 Tax=Nocardia sp. NPDC057227 TaxID=3346056 RepID=UPI00362BD37A
MDRLTRYRVDVHCCGPRWLIHVPSVARWTITGEKAAIRATAQRMIVAITGRRAESVELDLVAGRALRSVEEFTAVHSVRTRWNRIG